MVKSEKFSIIRCLLVAVLFVSACSGPTANNRDPSSQVIKALRHNDFALIQPLLLTEGDVDAMAGTMKSYLDKQQFGKDKFAKEVKLLEEETARFKKGMSEYNTRMREGFEQARTAAEREGIDWKKVRLVSKREKVSDSHLGTEKIKIFALIKSGDNSYMLEVGKYLKTSRGPIMVGSMSWKGKIGQAVSSMD